MNVDARQGERERLCASLAKQAMDELRAMPQEKPSYWTDIELPTSFCVRAGVLQGFSQAKVEAALDKHFAAFGIPKISELTWGWPDGECSIFDGHHKAIMASELALVDYRWARESLDYLLVSEGTHHADDFIEYCRWQSEALSNVVG